MVERPYYPPPAASPITSVFLVTFLVGILLIAIPSIGGTTAAGSACTGVYIVQPGDTLIAIAKRCGVSVPALLQANPQVADPTTLTAGQQLSIPASIPVTGSVLVPAGPPPVVIPNTGAADPGGQSILYTVVRGDTLGKIATQFGTTVQVLQQLNPQIANPDLIYPGQTIRIP